jgi:hypothetical protein
MAGEQIRITGGPASGQQIEIGQELQIGRSAGTEGRLGDDPEISRQHARITRNPQGELQVEDLGSTNGTFVNGQRISGPTVLNPGDTVQMGRSTLSVEGAAGGGQATAIGAVPVGAGPPPPPGPPTQPPTQALPPTGQQPAFAQQGPGGPGGPPPPGGFPGGPGGGNGGRNNGRIALIAGLIAAVVIGAIVLALVLSGGDDDNNDTTQASQASTPTTFTMDTSSVPTTETTTTEETTTDETTDDPGGGSGNSYPPNVKRQFVKGCQNGGGSKSACQCTIDAIEERYNLIEFLEIVEKANDSGKFPSGVQKIIRRCANA